MSYPLTEESSKNTIWIKLIRKNVQPEMHPMEKPIQETFLRMSLRNDFKLGDGEFSIRIDEETYPLNEKNLMFGIQRIMDSKDGCIVISFETSNLLQKRKSESNSEASPKKRRKLGLKCSCKLGCEGNCCSCRKNGIKCKKNICKCINCGNF